MRSFWTRTLILVLALRAILAPLTFGTTCHHPTNHNALVMRLRHWPPQRLQRLTVSSHLLELFRGKGRAAYGNKDRLALVAARTTFRNASFSPSVARTFRDRSFSPSTTSMRC